MSRRHPFKLREDDAGVLCVEVDSFEYQAIGCRDSYSELERAGAICSCYKPARGWYPKPIDVELCFVPTRTLQSPFGKGPLVVRREFFEIIRPYLTTQAVGRCSLRTPTGPVPTAECATLYDSARHHLWIRGEKGSKYLNCPDCGIPVDYIVGEHHLDRKTVTTLSPVAFSGVTLFVAKHVERQIRWQDFPQLRPIPVRWR